MTDMVSWFRGASLPYTDGFIQGLLLGSDTLINLATLLLSTANATKYVVEPIVGELMLGDANIDDVMSGIFLSSIRIALPSAKWTLKGHERAMRGKIDWDKTLIHYIVRSYFGTFDHSGQRIPSDRPTADSGDSWMYPYQRTPMGNPYISPISRGYLWVSYPQESQGWTQ